VRHRSNRWLLVAATLVVGCSWLRFVEPPLPIERKISVPFGEPGRVDLVTLKGAWLRAAEIASTSYFAGLTAPPEPSPLETCLLRRESYDVEVWEQRAVADGGEAVTDADAGTPDAGPASDGLVPPVLFVTISLHPGACDLGESPPSDTGGSYAIDTATWRIVGWRP
jgi:hypothetical protein